MRVYRKRNISSIQIKATDYWITFALMAFPRTALTTKAATTALTTDRPVLRSSARKMPVSGGTVEARRLI